MAGINALVPWYGANRMRADEPGKLLKGCSWVGVPFAGSMAEVPYITARSIVVNDMHSDLINLATVAAHPQLGPRLYRELRRKMFHPEELKSARLRLEWARSMIRPSLSWAIDYFTCAWMNRSAVAGTSSELSGSLPVRWTASGGDSAVRYYSATKMLVNFRRLMHRANFQCMDAFEFLGNVTDTPKNGLYIDAPWPDDGEKYLHSFTVEQQRELARVLHTFQHCRIVVRYGNHPLIRELYPAPLWTWHHLTTRTQANSAKDEVLLVNNPLDPSLST